ncbi:MAG: TraB/GumN family protein [Pseudomonadota bacterium]
MIKRFVPLALFGFMALPAWSQEAPPAAEAAAAPAPAPEKILVVGQRPGPGLWKVSKGEHVLWVFATYSPLPAKMEWRSQQVEAILAQSQEYLLPPGWSAGVGLWRGLTLLPYAIGFKKSPDGAHLKDLMPPEVHARWLALKDKYIGEDDDIERERPVFAADDLFSKALRKSGLSKGYEVRQAIEAIVKKNKIKTTSSTISVEFDDPAKSLKEFKKSSMDDIDCFSKTIDRLETDLDAMRVRANAWAKGDLDAIQKLSYADSDAACSAAFESSSIVKGQAAFQDMRRRSRDAWLAVAEKALTANASSFALLPLKDVLDPQGSLAQLQAKGYVVEKPE